MRMWTSGGPAETEFTVLMHGGGYQKGKRAGESYLTLSSSNVPGIGSMTIVLRHNTLYVKAGGSSTAPEPHAANERLYTVKAGDSLSKIAKHEYGDANAWPKIFEANKDILKDPNKIFPGQKLKIPPK